MNKIDRLLIGALVLGVWALVAMLFFGGMTASTATSQRGEVSRRPLYVEVVNAVEVDDGFGLDVEVTNWPVYQNVLVTNEAQVYCTNCN